MKKLLLVFLLLLNVHALDKMSTLSSDDQKVLDLILTRLDLSNTSSKNKSAIYKKINFALEKDWYINILHNETAKNSKVAKAKTKFIELTIIDENRIYSFTFIHFKKMKQILIISRQYIGVDSDYLLEQFEKLKKDDKQEKKIEKDKYAYFNEKGFMSDTLIQIRGKEGIISYIDMATLDLK